jgi:hypothetical protein
MDAKQKLIQELTHQTFIMLKPSPVQGIGVFAIRNIIKGQRNLFSNDKSEWIKIPKSEIEVLPASSRFLVENHCLYDDEHYYVPEYGFKMIDPVIYINHSDVPNIKSLHEGMDFEALRDINEGEEIFINYGEIVDENL